MCTSQKPEEITHEIFLLKSPFLFILNPAANKKVLGVYLWVPWMGRQNEKGKHDVNLKKKKSELTNDYNEYFIKIFLTLEEKRR